MQAIHISITRLLENAYISYYKREKNSDIIWERYMQIISCKKR